MISTWQQIFIAIVITVSASPLQNTQAHLQKREPKQKGSPAKSSPKPQFDTNAFDLSSEKLPANYIGNNVVTVISEVITKVPPKDDFETKLAYKTRAERAVDMNRVYAFKIISDNDTNRDGVLLYYDVERGAWMCWVSPPGLLAIVDFTNNLSHVAGRTASGKYKRVARRQRTLIFLDTGTGFDSIRTEISQTAEIAKQLQGNLLPLFICRLRVAENGSSLASTNDYYEEATVSDPVYWETIEYKLCVQLVAIWIYDRINGAIYKKIEINNYK